jgi:hypothetical protein
MVTHIPWGLVLSARCIRTLAARKAGLAQSQVAIIACTTRPKRNKVAIWELEGDFQRGIVIH